VGVQIQGRRARLTAGAAGRVRIERAAAEALERVLEQLRREQGLVESPTLAAFVEVYLAQHEGEPETTAKLRWLLQKAVRAFGERRLSELRSPAIAAWRMAIPAGHRFEATQALRQVLARAVSWGLLDINPAKLGVENPQRRYAEKRPFDSWDELYALAAKLGPHYGPIVVFAAATGLRPGEWLALERRDIDREAQVVYVRRTLRNGRVKPPKTKASMRAVPLQARPESHRCAGSTICDTRSRPSRSVLACPRSTSPATWELAWP
jgi:integrase